MCVWGGGVWGESCCYVSHITHITCCYISHIAPITKQSILCVNCVWMSAVRKLNVACHYPMKAQDPPVSHNTPCRSSTHSHSEVASLSVEEEEEEKLRRLPDSPVKVISASMHMSHDCTENMKQQWIISARPVIKST